MRYGEPSIDRAGEQGGRKAQQEILHDLKEKMGSEYYLGILRKLANGESLDDEEESLLESLKDDFKGYH
jgi:hypothetical protein